MMRRFRELCSQGCMGVFFLKGEGVEQDFRSAADWLQQAADQGQASAQRELGQLYRKGQGVQQDYLRAIKWFQSAGENGDKDGFNDLGLQLCRPQGVSLLKSPSRLTGRCRSGSSTGF